MVHIAWQERQVAATKKEAISFSEEFFAPFTIKHTQIGAKVLRDIPFMA